MYSRARLDYRRLEEAHLKFAVLNVYERYPSSFLSRKIYSIADTLEVITPNFYKAFEARYAGMFIYSEVYLQILLQRLIVEIMNAV